MKTWIGLVVTLVLVLTLAVLSCAQGTEPLSVVQALVEAGNAGDVDGWVNAFAADAEIKIVPFQTVTGQEAIRAWAGEQIAAHSVFGCATEYEVSGDTVTCSTLTHASDDFGPLVLEGSAEWIVKDGKIQTMTWTASDETMAALAAMMPDTGGAPLPVEGMLMGLGAVAALSGIGIRLWLRRRNAPS